MKKKIFDTLDDDDEGPDKAVQVDRGEKDNAKQNT